jgi:serine/threonine protein kinase
MPVADPEESAAIQGELKLYIDSLRYLFDKNSDGSITHLNPVAEVTVRDAINAHNLKYQKSPDDQRLSVGVIQAWYRKLIEEYDAGTFRELRIDDGIFIERPATSKTIENPNNSLLYSRSGALLCKCNESGNIVFPSLIDIKSKSEFNESLKGKIFFHSGEATICKIAFDVSDLKNISKYASLSFKEKDPHKRRLASEKMSNAIALNNKLAEKSIHFEKIFNMFDRNSKPHRYVKFNEMGDFADILRNDVLNNNYNGDVLLNREMIDFYGTEIEACKLDMLFQLAESLMALNDEEVSHNDLKPENIFCNYDETSQRILLTIGDPEMMKDLIESKPTIGGTKEYLPLEVWAEFAKDTVETQDTIGNSLSTHFTLFNLTKILYERYSKKDTIQNHLKNILKKSHGENYTSEQADSLAIKIFSQYPQDDIAVYEFSESELMAIRECNPDISDIQESIDELMMQARDPLYGLELFLEEIGLDPVTAFQIGKVYADNATLVDYPKLVESYNNALQKLINKIELLKNAPPNTDSYCGKKDQWATGIICMHVILGRFPDLLSDRHILERPPFEQLLSTDIAKRMTGSQFKAFVVEGLKQTPAGSQLMDMISNEVTTISKHSSKSSELS